MTTFSCQACGSPSFTVRGELAPTAEVCCASCGTALGSWETVLRGSVDLLRRLGVPHRRHGGPPWRSRAETGSAGLLAESGAAPDPR